MILEALKNPRKLFAVARRAHAQRKSLLFCQVGKSKTGQLVIGLHTGALAGNSQILQAFLRRCGIMAANSYDEFVEAIELLAHVPLDENMGSEVILVSGSGGGAAVATDHLDQAGMTFRELHPATLLVQLSRFAVSNAGRFRALDLNPIIVKRTGEGVVAVDIAVEHV